MGLNATMNRERVEAYDGLIDGFDRVEGFGRLMKLHLISPFVH